MDAVGRALDGDGTAVLATVIGVEGSAYRRPGAKMLVDADAGVGSITAGCLEDEVLDIADSVRAAGRPRVERFDLTGDDDVWGLGVGCNGVIDILLEPLGEGYRPVVDAYEAGDRAVVYTVVGGDEVGDRRGSTTPSSPSTTPASSTATASRCSSTP
jgi:xanthine dehydrogenase accessory factor